MGTYFQVFFMAQALNAETVSSQSVGEPKDCDGHGYVHHKQLDPGSGSMYGELT